MIEFDEQSNQMLYVSSESEALPYELVEEQRIYQNHSADYTLGVEPEFDEALPGVEPVEETIVVNAIHYDQNNVKDRASENVADSVSSHQIENAETLVPARQKRESSELSEGIATEETPHVNTDVETSHEPEEKVLPEETLSDEVHQVPDCDALLDTSQVKEDVESVSDELTPVSLEADHGSVDEVIEEDIKFTEPVAQSDEDAKAPTDELIQTVPDKDLLPEEDGEESDSEFIKPFAQAKGDVDTQIDESVSILPEADIPLEEEAPEPDFEGLDPDAQAKEEVEAPPPEMLIQVASDSSALSDEFVPEINSESATPTTPVEDAAEKDQEHNPESVPGTSSIDTAQQPLKEDDQKAEREMDAEEEKLAKQIEINPRSATTWEALGTLYKTAGRYDEAIQAFSQAISIAPGEVSYYHNLGLVYSAQGNDKEALNTFQKVLELDPNHSLAHASLGGYYKKMGLEELAQHHIGKAMKHIYESENEYNRACLDAICGNADQAIELLRAALENKQTYVDWVLHDPDLDSLRDDERFKQLVSDFSE
jgi:hypothetical protein